MPGSSELACEFRIKRREVFVETEFVSNEPVHSWAVNWIRDVENLDWVAFSKHSDII